jgi:hypothetical protein
MPEIPSAAERSLAGRIAALSRWGQLDATDRTVATAKARAALEAKFLREADGDSKRAKSIRQAYYARLQKASADARRRRSAGDAA